MFACVMSAFLAVVPTLVSSPNEHEFAAMRHDLMRAEIASSVLFAESNSIGRTTPDILEDYEEVLDFITEVMSAESKYYSGHEVFPEEVTKNYSRRIMAVYDGVPQTGFQDVSEAVHQLIKIHAAIRSDYHGQTDHRYRLLDAEVFNENAMSFVVSYRSLREAGSVVIYSSLNVSYTILRENGEWKIALLSTSNLRTRKLETPTEYDRQKAFDTMRLLLSETAGESQKNMLRKIKD